MVKNKLVRLLKAALGVVNLDGMQMRILEDRIHLDEVGITVGWNSNSVSVIQRAHDLSLMTSQVAEEELEVFRGELRRDDDAPLLEAARATVLAVVEFRLDGALDSELPAG